MYLFVVAVEFGGFVLEFGAEFVVLESPVRSLHIVYFVLPRLDIRLFALDTNLLGCRLLVLMYYKGGPIVYPYLRTLQSLARNRMMH